ncbi:phage antirepressor N-terminal domain-containing protein [Sulfuricurvum sp.]|uniref:phage antirepressor N-terminal domain-containing protein n=1 Tax=Sulfuricurvum sp. TaxID=2025608 RepID=UPI003BAED943
MDIVKVEFKSDILDIIQDDIQWVAVKAVTSNLGIQFDPQHNRLKTDETYQSKLIKIQTKGGMQDVFCIPLSKLNGWLFSINPNKVKPEVREKLIEYKNECFDALNDYFNKGAAFKPEVKAGLESHIFQLERENVELKRLVNRLTSNGYLVDVEKIKEIHQAWVNVKWRVASMIEAQRKSLAEETRILENLEKDVELMGMYEEFHGPYELTKPKKQKLLQ